MSDNWHAARQAKIAARLGRIEDYLWLRDQGETPAAIMQRLGVCARTIERYKRHLKAESRV